MIFDHKQSALLRLLCLMTEHAFNKAVTQQTATGGSFPASFPPAVTRPYCGAGRGEAALESAPAGRRTPAGAPQPATALQGELLAAARRPSAAPARLHSVNSHLKSQRCPRGQDALTLAHRNAEIETLPSQRLCGDAQARTMHGLDRFHAHFASRAGEKLSEPEQN